jgi:hypothetical protein
MQQLGHLMKIPYLAKKRKKERKKGGSARITTCTTDTLPSWHRESLSWPLLRREECINKEIPHTPQPSKPYFLQVKSSSMVVMLRQSLAEEVGSARQGVGLAK